MDCRLWVFASWADCRLPGNSVHPLSLSERQALQASRPPALVTDAEPLAMDIIVADRRVEPPPLKWSDSKYGFAPEEDWIWVRDTSLKRSLRSCVRWMF